MQIILTVDCPCCGDEFQLGVVLAKDLTPTPETWPVSKSDERYYKCRTCHATVRGEQQALESHGWHEDGCVDPWVVRTTRLGKEIKE